ncbi:unnamed protein product [Dovyalis caffra]|uniref:Uncharacterized protein n=1 Tax=Dovyalis caffra TaxID=77055 RepID=A0AAV1QU25_9ROSI|nr:unnamed protein product [Dovyalis caffra]
MLEICNRASKRNFLVIPITGVPQHNHISTPKNNRQLPITRAENHDESMAVTTGQVFADDFTVFLDEEPTVNNGAPFLQTHLNCTTDLVGSHRSRSKVHGWELQPNLSALLPMMLFPLGFCRD